MKTFIINNQIEIFVALIAMLFTYFGLFNAYMIKWKLQANKDMVKSRNASKIWHRQMWWTKVFTHFIVLVVTIEMSWWDIVGIQLVATLLSIPGYNLIINLVNFPTWYVDMKGINDKIVRGIHSIWNVILKIVRFFNKKVANSLADYDMVIAKRIYWVLQFVPYVVGVVILILK